MSVNRREPTISIITAVYNSVDTIQDCIDSVRRQRYSPREFIVIDGASTDGSVDIIRKNEDAISYWSSEPDRGIYHAWNKGVERATGEWIHFLGADDYFMHEDVLTMIADGIVRRRPEIRVVYGKEAIVSPSGEVLELRGEAWETAGRHFNRVMSIPHPTVFHHRRIFEERGIFDESFRVCADYELLLRELRRGDALFLENVVVKAVTFGGISTSPKRSYLVALEMPRAKRLNGIFPYDGTWLWILAKAWGKYCLHQTVGAERTRRIIDAYRRLTGRPQVWTRS